MVCILELKKSTMSPFTITVFLSCTGGSLSFPLPCAVPDEDGNYEGGQSIEPISVAFTLVFGVLLFVQFLCMLLHRIATLLHICAATEIFKKKRKVSRMIVFDLF